MARFSVELHDYFFSDERQTEITLVDVLELAGERVFGFLLVLLALPSALPIPAPGYSVPFGILILVLAVQMIVGRARPWFPRWFSNRSITLTQARSVIKAGIPWLKRLEAISRPRYTFFCTSVPGRVLLGSAIALMGLSMMIPLPLTNTLPAMGVFIIGFSLIEDDGVISLMGLTVSLIAAILSSTIIGAFIIGGPALVNTVIDQIRTLKP